MNVSLAEPGALRSVLGAAMYLTVAGMTGVALGALLRNTAATITIFVGVYFVIPPMTNLLPTSWTDHIVAYLPSNAGAMMLDGPLRCGQPLGTVDRIRGDECLRAGPDRDRRGAAAPRGRLSRRPGVQAEPRCRFPCSCLTILMDTSRCIVMS